MYWKRISRTVLCMAVLGVVFASLSVAMAAQNPIVWLKFDEKSGATASDSSGNGINGTLENGPTWVAGKVGGALSFDGVDDYVTLPAGMADFSNGLTIAIWVNPAEAVNYGRIIDFGNGKNTNNIDLIRKGVTNDLLFRVRTSGWTNLPAVEALELNQWQHFAITLDSAGNATIYKNGVQIAAGASIVPPNIERISNLIGKSNGEEIYFQGMMDDLRIYNQALTAEEIAALL